MCFCSQGFANSFVDGGEVDSVPICFLVQLDHSGSNIIEGQGNGCGDSCGKDEGEWVYESVLSEPGEESFFEVVIWSGNADVENQMS